MSRFGSASFCYQCEKKIPWRERCVWCRNPLCLTCRCSCALSQPNSTPMDPNRKGMPAKPKPETVKP